ncbi:DUF5615 family PIN-like protein [Candidatus Curtissbacteria bacterium]|nr:DUF5615 family PIN-like protein [Candidatus Curtissbacteria bacterium]
MPRKFHKHKLLLDDSRFDVKHIADDLNQTGLSDKEVHRIASGQGRIVVTLNIKDFKPLASTNRNTGVIGVSATLPFSQVDKKLNSLLSRSSRKQLLDKLIIISGETKN